MARTRRPGPVPLLIFPMMLRTLSSSGSHGKFSSSNSRHHSSSSATSGSSAKEGGSQGGPSGSSGSSSSYVPPKDVISDPIVEDTTTVTEVAQLPSCTTANEGETFMVDSEKSVYFCVGGQWIPYETVGQVFNVTCKDGVLSLEEAASNIDDEFLKKGIMLVVDGTDPDLVRAIMETEMTGIEGRLRRIRRLWRLRWQQHCFFRA